MVVLKGKVYIGGGYAMKDVEKKTVIVYNPLEDSYSTLLPYTLNVMYFSMAVVNNQLVLVGGQDLKDYKKTNKLGVWSEPSRQWTHPLPPMTIACDRPTVVTHKDRWLIVIGGSCGGCIGSQLSRVQILDIFSKQWHHSTPMPEMLMCSHSLTATIGSTCYLVGGYLCTLSALKRVLSVSLDKLVSQADISKSVSATNLPTPSLWQNLPDTPLEHSTPLALDGTLLAIGGALKLGDKPKNTIYAYHPESEEWVKIGEMPVGRAQCSCIVLPSGEIMVAGVDHMSRHSDIVAQQMDLATVL